MLAVNAASSAMVDASGDFRFSFLEEGEYEIIHVKYKTTASWELEFESTIDAKLRLNGLLMDILKVIANSEASVVLSLF